MNIIVVGKMDGRKIVPLPESQYDVIAGTPLVGDVVEMGGKISVVGQGGWHEVTREFIELVGWDMDLPFPAKRSDVYDT